VSSAPELVRLAAVGDIHCSKRSAGALHPLLAKMNSEADVVLLCGDLTDYGQPEEATILAELIRSTVTVPVVGVLGNHDFESGRQVEVRQILEQSGITILDGDTEEIEGIGFAGTKGFAGGFGKATLEPWGEQIIKLFVREAVNEALKLEKALSRLSTQNKVVLLHYSPIVDTLVGEPPEIYSYLGSQRLGEPLNRFPPTVIFHGHAHHGTAEARTPAGTPVYNVALPLLKSTMREATPFKLFTLEREIQEGRPSGELHAASTIRSVSSEKNLTQP
jgi:Icc-related predicted phosphoesterase